MASSPSSSNPIISHFFMSTYHDSKLSNNDSQSLSSVTMEKTELASDLPATKNEEEDASIIRRYCRKLDIYLLPYTIVFCILNQMDRTAIGVAKVAGLEEDLGLHRNEFNIAATLFTCGFLSLEFFSNFVLKKVGASKLLPTMGIIWGTICTLQGIINTRPQLYAMRFLLGMAECGFTTGVMLLISFFYPKSKITSRVAIFNLSSPLANVISGPLASGLSSIKHHTIRKWQWIFLVEGIMTVLVALPGYYLLQDHPEKCRFINDKEKEAIVKCKQRDGTLGGSQRLTLKETKQSLSDWQLWAMTIPTFSTVSILGSISVFAPEIIHKLGFTPSQSQAMSALPSIFGFFALLFSGHLVRLCRGHWAAGILCLSVMLTGSIILAASTGRAARMAGLCLVGTGGFANMGILPGWIITANSRNVADSTVAASLVMFMGACSSFVSLNVFLNWDAPRFLIGHGVNIGLAGMGILMCLIVRVSMGRRNKKLNLQDEGSDDGFRFVY